MDPDISLMQVKVQGHGSVLSHGSKLLAFLKIKAEIQGEISTNSSLLCTSFFTVCSQSLYYLVQALLLRFHQSPLNKLLIASHPFSEDPTQPLITGGYSLVEWGLLLKLLKTRSLATCLQCFNLRKRRVSLSKAQWTLDVLNSYSSSGRASQSMVHGAQNHLGSRSKCSFTGFPHTGRI